MADVVVTSINIRPKDIILAVGDKKKIEPVIKPGKATNQKVMFDSSDNGIATVDESGKVVAIAEGLAVVTAVTDDGGFTDSVKVKVEGKSVVMEPVVMEDVAVTGVSVAPESVSLKVGGSQQLTAMVEPDDATDKSVSWSVDDDNVALVDSGGLVEGVFEGAAEVSVTTLDGGFTDVSAITVEGIDHLPVDITDLAIASWPGNTPHRVGSYFFNLSKMKLQKDQSGLLGNFQDYFIFERADLHCIEPTDINLDIEILMDNKESLGRFNINNGEFIVSRQSESEIPSGSRVSRKDIYLRLHSVKPEKGRLLISMVGYLIEPWR